MPERTGKRPAQAGLLLLGILLGLAVTSMMLCMEVQERLAGYEVGSTPTGSRSTGYWTLTTSAHLATREGESPRPVGLRAAGRPQEGLGGAQPGPENAG